MKLLIAVPCLDYINVRFVKSLNALTNRLNKDGVDFEVRFEVGALVYLARDNLVQYASKNCFTHVLWLDSDMVFDDDIYYKLKAVNAEFATAACRSRHGEYKYCILKNQDEHVTELPNRPFEVYACGFACALTTTLCLEHISEKNNGHPFEPTRYWGEDFQFCIRAQGMGYKIICNPEAKCGHIGSVEIWPDSEVDMLHDYVSKEAK